MISKRIALIGYSPIYFASFAAALEQAQFVIHWVHATRSAAVAHVRRGGTAPARILDTTLNFVPDFGDPSDSQQMLSGLEFCDGPRLNDIILMDRVLKKKPRDFSLKYLAHLQRVLTAFLSEHDIQLVSSGRDTALQLMSMLVCRQLGIAWVSPARVRIPHNLYMFTSGHDTESIVRIRAGTRADRAWAETFLEEFRSRAVAGLLKAATTTFVDVIRIMPRHARLFIALVAHSLADLGNDFSRYTVPRIIAMYLRRRFNMLLYKLFPPYSTPRDRPYCLYALHTQPESSIDVTGSFFSDQIALITFIARSLPVTYDLYVKIHPTDVDGRPISWFRQIAQIPSVRLIGHEVGIRGLLDRTSLVFTLTGTVGYEAGLIGKPVVTFAKNFYNGMPTVHYWDSPPALPSLIASLLTTPISGDVDGAILSFLAELKTHCFEGEVNRMYQPDAAELSEKDLAGLRQAYESLFDVLAKGGYPQSITPQSLKNASV